MASLPTPQTKAAATRIRILDAAASLFWRRSYHAVAMDEVAAATGINKATIYRYFADKADLAKAVTRHNGENVEAGVFERVFREHSAPDDRILAIYSCIYSQLSDLHGAEGDMHGCPIVGLTLELGLEMPELRQISAEIFGRIERRFELIAMDAIATQMTPRPGIDASEIASTLVKILHGAFVSSRIAGEPTPFLQAANASLVFIGSEKRLTAHSGESH